jgi:cell wall-associated NlpC family hydrolase
VFVTPRRLGALLSLVLATAVIAPAAHTAPGSLSSAREKARGLESRIEQQGEQLSIANEQYNAARYRRTVLLADLQKTKAGVASSEQRYQALRDRLGDRVRALYKHPGAPYEVWFNMRSLDQTGRQQVLSNSVLTADSDLVSATDRARRELRAKLRSVSALSATAKRTQEAIAGQRIELAEGLSAQRSLLSQVKGNIARILAEERRRELAQAPRSIRGIPPNTPAQNRAANGAAPIKEQKEADIPAPPPAKGGASTAVSAAAAQIGKPYKWGAAGPDSFDCSGLTMYAWAEAGVQLAHFAASQYDALPKVPRDQLQPGDLVFFGNPIHHVGIYEGGGVMINAPQTGENVRRNSIGRADYVGASRP